MAKSEIEFTPTDAISWQQQDGAVPGMLERVLSYDTETGDLTRLTTWKPGTDSSTLGVQSHPYWEECYILDGSIEDLTLGETFYKGYYTCRPPGMRHGPWRTADGVVFFEIRAYPR